MLVGAAALLLFGAGFIELPGMVVDHDLGTGHVAPQDRLTAINDVRTTLLQMAAGVVLFFGAYATWRQLRVSQDTLRITQEGHLTEQFGRAIDQLGGDKLDVRIGGLHALRRLAEYSTRDRDAVSPRSPRSCGRTSRGLPLGHQHRPSTPTSTRSRRWKAGQPTANSR